MLGVELLSKPDGNNEFRGEIKNQTRKYEGKGISDINDESRENVMENYDKKNRELLEKKESLEKIIKDTQGLINTGYKEPTEVDKKSEK